MRCNMKIGSKLFGGAFLPGKLYFLQSLALLLAMTAVGMLLSVIPIIIVISVGGTLHYIAYAVIVAIGQFTSFFVGSVFTEFLYDASSLTEYASKYEYKRYKISLLVRIFAIHIPVLTAAFVIPLFVDSPIVGILLFQVAGSSAAILGTNSFLSLELSEYICPNCGGLMENTDIKTYYNEYNETTGGNAHFRNVKLGEAKSESGKTFEVYGQQTYYSPEKHFKVTEKTTVFYIVCPVCGYSDKKEHRLSEKSKRQIY